MKDYCQTTHTNTHTHTHTHIYIHIYIYIYIYQYCYSVTIMLINYIQFSYRHYVIRLLTQKYSSIFVSVYIYRQNFLFLNMLHYIG